MSDEQFSGTCLVIRGEKVFKRTSGLADRVTGRPWTMDTQSQVASISKQFAVACALILADRGALQLDDPVTLHIPAAAPAWDEVSVRQLMTHTSGMSHWGDEPGFFASSKMPPHERLRLLLRAERPRRPGKVFRYSSPGYIVLSAVLAVAAGLPYQELVCGLVIEPLGLAATHLGSPGPSPVALGYRKSEPVASWDLGSMQGAGDVWSTAPDLARFVSALHTGELLTAAAQPLLYELRVPVPASSETRIRADGYQAGHFTGTVDGQPAYLHPGDNPGYQALAIWFPESSAVVVVLSNDEMTDIEAVAADALRELPKQ